MSRALAEAMVLPAEVGRQPWQIAMCPTDMKGAPQVVRGPVVSNEDFAAGCSFDVPPVNGSWVWCAWRLSDPSPGGWPARVKIVLQSEAPEWLRDLLAGAS